MAETVTILNVDDTEAGRYAKTRVLKRAGYEVAEAGTGGDALRLVEELRPPLVLLDIKLPDMSGLEVCAIIKRRHPEIIVLQISASFIAGDDRVRGLESGADGYLTQPVEPRELAASVHSLLRIRQAETAVRESETRFRNMADNTPVMMWVTDPTGFCTYLNARWYEFTGQTETEALGLGWTDATHPDDKQRAMDTFLAANEAQGPFYIEYRLRRADGVYRWAIDTASPRFGPGGEYLGYVGSVIDISERKEAELALATNEERYRGLVRAIGTMVFGTPPDGYVEDMPEWRALTGQTLEQVRGYGWLDAILPEDRARTEELWRGAVEGRTLYNADYRVRHVDGVYRWINARGAPVLNPDGSIREWVGLTLDIEAQKRAEAALAESEAKFRAIAESMPQMVWSTLPDGFHDYYNERWYEFTGAAPGSTDGQGWSGILHPDDQPRARERWRHSLRTGNLYEIEYRLRRADGVYRWVLGRASPVRDETGAITRWFGTCTDIEDQVRAREVLERSQMRLEAEVEERTRERDRAWSISQDLFMIGGLDGFYRLANPAWKALGYEPAELVGLRFDAIVHPDDVANTTKQFERLVAGETLRDLDIRIRAKDGSYRWYSWYCVPEGEFFYAAGRDIEERRQLEEQLRQAQKMEAVGQLTGGVAHDFNNLLTIVIGGLETIQRLAPEDAGRLRRSADNAMRGATRAAALTQRLLAFSRRQPLAPKPTDVNRLVADMSDLLHRTLGETVELETVQAGGLWRVEVDPNQLENALLNLAVNARDAMPDGGKLTIETANTHLDANYALSHSEVTPGQYVVICTTDRGEGMSREVVERVFEPFFTTKEVGKGTGLGLSQVYGFVKQSGGHVKVYSEVGQGTTVKIYLPRLIGAVAEDAIEIEEAVPEGTTEETVLVVEDDDDVRTYSVEVLRELGYRVLEAHDGASALRLLERQDRVDLLFSDVVLPGGMNGERLAAAARDLRPGLKVLFTTGYARNAIVHQGRLDPGVQLITKPFTYAELAAKIRDVIDMA